MPKLSLTDLASLTNETSAIAAINNNNTLVENALENTLSRDGTSPNSMNSNLDMNSYRIQNLPIPIGGTEPIRKNEFDETLAGIQASQVTNGSVPTPVLENVGNYLKATGIGNYTWSDVAGSGAVSLTNYNETAITSKTTFTITGGYTSTSVFVYLNGVLLEPSEYVASNGTTVVLNSVCAIGDEFRCISFAPFAAITLGALASKNTVAAGDIDANAVTDTKIAANAVTDTKIAAGAVLPSKLALGAWTTVASAATVDLGAQTSRNIVISGTAGITSFGSTATPDNVPFNVRFSGSLTLTHSTNLICPGAANITTAAGDTLAIVQDVTGTWRIVNYQRATNPSNLFTAGTASGNLVRLSTGNASTGTYSRAGTTVTVTITAHGYTTGQFATLTFTTGTATSGTYQVTSTGANTFTVTDTVSGATSGNVSALGPVRMPAIDGALLVNLPSTAPTTTQVLNATAGAAYAAVGTYVFGKQFNGSATGAGGTSAGSDIAPSNAAAQGSDVLSGTWRCMGISNSPTSSTTTSTTLWLRIS